MEDSRKAKPVSIFYLPYKQVTGHSVSLNFGHIRNLNSFPAESEVKNLP